ncbi:unnamed protein product [Phytophthora fragariaefolia]|uniref:Unnamed protein product n=1 Tax=Phytophthora fragariaefolia TaxID=1490495 RepID=A0A9W6U8U1_9STRA|nr:unnamed protein product [Phytophthora fragariaefolia]
MSLVKMIERIVGTTFQQVRQRFDIAFANISSKAAQACIDKARANLQNLCDNIKFWDDVSEIVDEANTDGDDMRANNEVSSKFKISINWSTNKIYRF